ncbi:MAG: choice-of-anchor Q domain-containing protein [Pseudomonadota bacterium]
MIENYCAFSVRIGGRVFTAGIYSLLIALTAVMLKTPNAYAATREVGTGKPYTTIQSAINAANAGDTILVYTGTYNETLIVGKTLSVKSVNGAGSTIIDATGHGGLTSAVAFSSGLGRDTVLDGFTISHGMNFQGGNIKCYNSSPTISNCFVYGGGAVYGAGVACSNGSSPLLTNCVISGNLCAYGAGIYCSISASPTIINCTIYQNRADNDGTIADANGAGIFCNSASATVINTVIWGNTANGLSNTIHLKSGGAVSVSYSNFEGGWIGAGNISSDPQFVQLGYWNDNGTPNIGDDYWISGDFHLQELSPCIDTATGDNAPDHDLEGTTRPQGYGYDMGSYEYVASTLISLSDFSATPQSGIVILNWSTASEIDNAGFNLYRSTSENGEYVKINEDLIPAQGSATQGASYDFMDVGLQNRKTYFYKLEDIDLNGTTTMHEPVSAMPRLLYGLFQ